jgi:hypothetical protein
MIIATLLTPCAISLEKVFLTVPLHIATAIARAAFVGLRLPDESEGFSHTMILCFDSLLHSPISVQQFLPAPNNKNYDTIPNTIATTT